MGRLLSIVALGMAAALSTSVLPQLLGALGGILGNIAPIMANARGTVYLVMLMVLAWSLRAGIRDAFYWALIGGIMLDLLSILPIGTSSAALAVIVYVANGVARQLLRIRAITVLAMTAAASLFFYACNLLALLLLGQAYDPALQLRLVLLPTLLYNLAAALPVFAIARFLQRRAKLGEAGPAAGLTRQPELGAAP